MKIITLRKNETLLYAAEELKKYVELVDPSVSAEIVEDMKYIQVKLIIHKRILGVFFCENIF